MLKYITKHIRRSAVTNALFCLLLVLAGTLFCITAGLWFSAQRSLRDIDEVITTIAMPDMRAIGLSAIEYLDNSDITEIETPMGMLSFEEDGSLMLDGVDLVQSFLLDSGYDSLEELDAVGIEVLIFHKDAGTTSFSFFASEEERRWADIMRTRFVESLSVLPVGFAAQGNMVNNINNIVICLFFSAEENFRINALPIIANEKTLAAREMTSDLDAIEHGGLLWRDERRVFGAFSDDAEAITLQMTGIGIEPSIARLTPQGFVVLLVTVSRVETFRQVDTGNWFVGRNIEHAEEVIVHTELLVREVIYSYTDFLMPRTVNINNVRFSDGSYMFEQGGSYIVMGNLRLGQFFAGRRDNYISIDYSSSADFTEAQWAKTGYIYDVEQLDAILNPHAGWARFWEGIYVPAEPWLEIADQIPFDENEHFRVPWREWNLHFASLDSSTGEFIIYYPHRPAKFYEFDYEYVFIRDGELFEPDYSGNDVEYTDEKYVQFPAGWVYLPEIAPWERGEERWRRAEELNRLVIDEEFLAGLEEGLPFVTEGDTVIIGTWDWQVQLDVRNLYLPRDQFPIEVVEWVYESNPDINTLELGIARLGGASVDDITPEIWDAVSAQIEFNEASASAFRILTSNNPVSVFSLHQQRNLMYDGRMFTADEIRDGERVALVSQAFAEHNGLSVGDTLSLELYNTTLKRTEITFGTGREFGGATAEHAVWIPTMYRTDLELSEPLPFTITGIYRTSTIWDIFRPDYAISPDTVIIPDNSFGELYGVPTGQFELLDSLSGEMPGELLGGSPYTPLLDDALIVANGRIDEVVTLLNSYRDGLGDSFIFFDQGYDALVGILNNLLFGTTWIFVLAAIGWAVVAFVFTMFYVMRKRKEAALLHAIGISGGKRTLWVFVQCAVVILLALAISLAVALPLYSDIIEVAAGVAEEFSHELRDLRLSDAEDTGLRANIPISEAPIGVTVSAAGGALLLLIIAATVSARSSVFKTLNKVVED